MICHKMANSHSFKTISAGEGCSVCLASVLRLAMDLSRGNSGNTVGIVIHQEGWQY